MSKSLLTHITLIVLISAVLGSNYKVNPQTRFFIDQYNRSVLFHGVNTVYKPAPYVPIITDAFDPIASLSTEDFQNLHGWGLRFIRLYIAWQGVEPVRGQYNETYLSAVRDIVRNAAASNITVLLDTHQDVVSPKFCGEGFPDWAVNRTDFPAPLQINITFDDQGHANIEDCLQKSFAFYYTTNDVRNALKSFYTDVDGIAESFTNFWKTVADYFKDEPNVLGYEIINEPSAISESLDDVDKTYLQPLYQRVHQKIREVDNNTIIFFEPMVFDTVTIGLTEGPGGEEYNDRQAFSYHLYCGAVDPSGEPINPEVCIASDRLQMSVKANFPEKIGVAGFMTEFGALSDSTKSTDEVTRVTGLADDHLHSWSYWQLKWYNDYTTAAKPATTESFYNVDGSLQSDKVKALARSYAYATCGVPTSQTFDPSNGKFVF